MLGWLGWAKLNRGEVLGLVVRSVICPESCRPDKRELLPVEPSRLARSLVQQSRAFGAGLKYLFCF